MGQIFSDEVPATAILDRLLHHCGVISINGPSYRLAPMLPGLPWPFRTCRAVSRDLAATRIGGTMESDTGCSLKPA